MSPGTTSAKSLKSSTKFLSISSAVNASIDTGISYTDCSFFVALTTTSSISCAIIWKEKSIVRITDANVFLENLFITDPRIVINKLLLKL